MTLENKPLFEFESRVKSYVSTYGWTDVRTFKVEEIV